MPRFKCYYLNEEEDPLFLSNAPIWRKDFGRLHKISAALALDRYGIEAIRECEERAVIAVVPVDK